MPDQDELAKLAPPPTTPTSTTVTGERPVTSSLSSVDSEATPTITAVEGGDTGEGMAERVRVETSPAPSVEVADDHISILSKYISDDQVYTCTCTCTCTMYTVSVHVYTMYVHVQCMQQ